MATSGTTTFNATRDQIIASALRKVAAIAEGDTPNPAQTTNAAFTLDTIIKEAQVDGMPLWAVKQVTIPCSSFVNGQIIIGIGQTLNIPAPLKVLYSMSRDSTNSAVPTDIPMTLLTKFDYNWLSSKFNQGIPLQFYYDPGNQIGTLTVWPIPSDTAKLNHSVIITYQRPFEDAGTSTDTLDFPQYWTSALIYQLAWRLAPEYGVPIQDRSMLGNEANGFWERALSFGSEEGSIKLAPDWSYKK